MQYSTIALLSGAAFVAAQGVTEKISPTAAAPASCTGTVNGDFEITIYEAQDAPSKRDLTKRQSDRCSGEGALVITLKDGVLLDNKDRTGYIADNYQFQFDGPAQTGAIYTAGWSICPQDLLALGANTTFYRCLSGSFYNLYNVNWAPQCEPISIGAIPCDGTPLVADSGATAPSSAPEVSASPDGQPIASSTASAPSAAVSQISDGQIQGPSVVPMPAPSLMVSQITDGQIQLPTGVPPSAPAPVSQISDGQIQAPSAPAATAPSAVVTQIGDGQIQAPTAAPSAPPAANSTVISPPIATGAASTIGASMAAIAVGLVAAAFL